MTHLWRRQVPRRYQTTLQYYSKNKSSKKITTNEDNAIEDINGIADNIQEQIREEDFTYADQNDIFWSEDNNPKVIKKFEIDDGNFCCARIINFHLGDKDYFIAGNLNPQIYKAEQPFNQVALLDINIREMIQINGSNL